MAHPFHLVCTDRFYTCLFCCFKNRFGRRGGWAELAMGFFIMVGQPQTGRIRCPAAIASGSTAALSWQGRQPDFCLADMGILSGIAHLSVHAACQCAHRCGIGFQKIGLVVWLAHKNYPALLSCLLFFKRLFVPPGLLAGQFRTHADNILRWLAAQSRHIYSGRSAGRPK